MSDSVEIKLDSIYRTKIDTILNSTNEIRKFSDYQMTPHHPHEWWQIMIASVLAALPIIWWLIKAYRKYKAEDMLPTILTKEYRGNFIWFFGWMWFLGFFFLALYFGGKIHEPKLGFSVSHFDFILAIATLLAIGGAIWAVYARIDAERAFHKSEQTLEALGNSFDFSKILDKDKIPDMFFQINRDKPLENIDISLYLGFPAVAYLYAKKDKFKYATPEDVFLTFRDFVKGLNYLLSKDKVRGLTFQLNIFSLKKCKEILQAKEGKEFICLKSNPKDNILETFYNELEILKSKQISFEQDGKPKRCPDTQNLIIINMGKEIQFDNERGEKESRFAEDFKEEEKFRFVIFEHKMRNTQPTKAIVWVVPDVTNNNGFESSAFQTNDYKFIQVLESVFVT